MSQRMKASHKLLNRSESRKLYKLLKRAYGTLCDLTCDGEFASWFEGKDLPLAVARELDEAVEVCSKIRVALKLP